MKKFISALTAASMIGAMSLTSVAPATAASFPDNGGQYNGGQQNGPQHNYGQQNGGQRYGNRWNNHRYYNQPRSAFPGIAAGIVGLAAGAAVAGAINNSHYQSANAHIRACEAHYRSYDVRTNTFVGYNGQRYACNF
jgi:hypothetical protein